MKQRFFLLLFSFFSLSRASSEIALPLILSKPELYAGLVTAGALYNMYDVYRYNKNAKTSEGLLKKALQIQKEDLENEQEKIEDQIKELKKLQVQHNDYWQKLPLDNGTTKKLNKISLVYDDEKIKTVEALSKKDLLHHFYRDITQIFEIPDIESNGEWKNVKIFFEKKDNNAALDDQDLDRLFIQLEKIVSKKIAILKEDENGITNDIEKKIFEPRSYKATISLIVLASLFWIPTILRVFGYKIRFSDQMKRGIPSLSFDMKEIVIPSFILDPRLYMIGLSLVGCADLLRIAIKNGRIQKENREIDKLKIEQQEYNTQWNELSNNKDEKVRKQSKINLINHCYDKRKNFLLAQEEFAKKDGGYSDLKSIPNTKKLNAIFRSKDPDGALKKLDEYVLDFYNTLILNTGTAKQKLLKYKSPFIWFSLSNCFAFYAVFFKDYSNILHVQRN